ncbi:MAG: TonB-dependent receptor, partial [Flavisolibacter sp.]|nr:TonB-dependent receptor [Flavisolibacter sp.]
IYGALITGSENNVSRVSYQRQSSNGYRNHSEMKRDVLSWNGLFRFDEKRQLRTTFLYGDLFYETPGALTLSEYQSNPKLARPGNVFFPGSEAAGAAVYQKTFLAGASYTQSLTDKLQSKSALYGAFTELRNPNLRAYDKSSEPHVGGRTVFTFKQPFAQSLLTLNGGGEWQQGYTTVSSFKNVGGNADSLRSNDEIRNRQSFVFAQAVLDIKDWTLTAGASWNELKVKFQRFNPRALVEQKRKFDNEIAPRFSLAKKWKTVTVYSSVAKGFSPPTTAELLPTGGGINLGLNAEDGINYDLGVRGTFWNRLNVDVNAFVFALKNTIVQRRDAGGGDFFINAGRTKQHGIETALSYSLFKSSSFVDRSLLWVSHTWHQFRYKEFKQLSSDFSGNRLPGVAPHTISSGFDLFTHPGFFANITYFYSDEVPLTDANDAFAESYHLVGSRLGYQKTFKEKWGLKLSVGADNLLNERYSLGNDINGFGGRYYNAAPGRNYFASLLLQWIK